VIHYGLQYRELLRKAVDAVTSARLGLAEAELEAKEAERKLAVSTKGVEKATQELEATKSILDVRIQRTPFEAVEQYKTDTGRYPI
jgi:hypothetical protein